MEKPPEEVHGSARYDPATKTLYVRRLLAMRKGTPVYSNTEYRVEHLDPDADIGSPAVRLTKPDGSSYDLIRTEHGWVCECWDWRKRRCNSQHPCKHVVAVLKAGVLTNGRPPTTVPPCSGLSDADSQPVSGRGPGIDPVPSPA